MQEDFYINSLYPLQDEVLSYIATLDTPFYLTGGTALSRHYFHHRYSDDLDFFVNRREDFSKIVSKIVNELSGKFTTRIVLTDTSYVQLRIIGNSIELKVEFVNDVLFHAGEFISSTLFSKIDSWNNILSNKISALSRGEGKDISDILTICENFNFNWSQIIEDAKNKDMWVEELAASQMINEFPLENLKRVKWISQPNWDEASLKLQIISKDILLGSDNSLVKK